MFLFHPWVPLQTDRYFNLTQRNPKKESYTITESLLLRRQRQPTIRNVAKRREKKTKNTQRGNLHPFIPNSFFELVITQRCKYKSLHYYWNPMAAIKVPVRNASLPVIGSESDQDSFRPAIIVKCRHRIYFIGIASFNALHYSQTNSNSAWFALM